MTGVRTFLRGDRDFDSMMSMIRGDPKRHELMGSEHAFECGYHNAPDPEKVCPGLEDPPSNLVALETKTYVDATRGAF